MVPISMKNTEREKGILSMGATHNVGQDSMNMINASKIRKPKRTP